MRLVIAMAALCLAGAASADPVAPAAVRPLLHPARAAPPAQTAPLALRRTPDVAMRPPGIAQTGIERALSSRVSGSAGFICGRPDGPDVAGIAAARGYDPHGRFVGASLRMSF
jgi:hypothetical protein